MPAPSQDVLKEIFNLYDEELDGKIDGTQIGDVARAAGLKPTQAMVVKASGQEFKRKGEKRITFEEWLPIYEQLAKEKEQGTYADFFEGLKVFDKEETGKILAAELRHILLALGERLSADEADELLKGVEDGEGMVKYEDFIKKVLAGPFPDQE
uniref:Myosin light chain 3 n=1 Tax=Caenorhabditis tropicalis TaxID=1561998 RepID=A0A1I7TIU1_9PELO